MRGRAGTRCGALTQTIDIAPTLLELFGASPPAENQGISLLDMLGEPPPRRDAVLYGVFGSAVNITDGRYTYFRYPRDLKGADLFQYTLMPAHMKELFSVAELADATLAPPMAFTKGVPLLKVPATPKSPVYFGHGPGGQQDTNTVLYDLRNDPAQSTPIVDAGVEARLTATMTALMRAVDAPVESFARLGLDGR
jgi:hypothetical protein